MNSAIPERETWSNIIPILYGWSKDRKYQIILQNGQKCLLRISPIDQMERKQKEFAVVQRFNRLPHIMSRVISFGSTLWEGEPSVYMLLSWVEGESLEDALPRLTPRQQYQAGRQAGSILKDFHSLPLKTEFTPSPEKKRQSILDKLEEYKASAHLRIAGDEKIIQFITGHIKLIRQDKPALCHGDYHPGNLILTPEGSIGVIDFNRCRVSDSAEDFYKLQFFGKECSIPYCVGQIDGYFDSEPPKEFWELLAVYCAWSSLYSVKWAEPFGMFDVSNMARRRKECLEDYEWFHRISPKWFEESRKAAWRDLT
jgi:aminoglycoside phosphotransferase (APT) family kinase protein